MSPPTMRDQALLGAAGVSSLELPTISDLYAHYDASDSTTIEFGSGAYVDKWINKEGTTDRDLIQATPDYQPTRMGAQRNGLDTIQFNSNDSMYTYSSTLSNLSEPFTIMCVAKQPSNDNKQHFLWSEYGGAPTLEKNNTSNKYVFTYSAGVVWTSASAAVGNYVDFTCIGNDGSSSMRYNNTEVATGGAADTFKWGAIGNHGGMRGSPGGGSVNSTTGWASEICEIAIWEKQLSSSELTEVWEYTEEKWNL